MMQRLEGTEIVTYLKGTEKLQIRSTVFYKFL